jgi:hypothetical protein
VIQYAVAHRFTHMRLWNTGSPGQAGRSQPRLAIAIPSHSRGALSPGFCNLVVPLSDRGRRESRALDAPAAPCARVAKESTRV